jgi:hypothetical protein
MLLTRAKLREIAERLGMRRPVNVVGYPVVGRGWKLSHDRGQIEPPASLPGGALVGYSGEVMFEER